MSGKNQFPVVFNWQATDPSTGFNPNSNQNGSAPSGVVLGAMASTNAIYSQIIDISKMDNQNLEVSWTGTATGTLQVKTSNSGANFSALTFAPALAQPSGVPGFYTVELNQLGCKFMLLQYTNTSGAGAISVYGQQKDLN